MPHLLSCWPSISKPLGASACRLILVAFGRQKRLRPSGPPRLEATAGIFARMGRLAARNDFLVGAMSPLSLVQMRSQIHNPRLVCVANRGLEISDGGRSYRHPNSDAEKHFLIKLASELTELLSTAPKCLVENNGLGLVVHCAQAVRTKVRKIIARAIAAHPRLALIVETTTDGLEIFLDLPWNEASAVHWIERLMPHHAATLYIGSQVRDEIVFNYLKEDGIGIRTHPKRSSAASFYLRDDDDIPMLLDKLLNLPQGTGC